MPFEMEIDAKLGLVTRTGRGRVTVDEAIACFEGTAAHPEFRPGMKSIIDLRGVEHSMDGDDIRRLSQFLRENRTRIGTARAAIVVSRTVTYGLMRMVQAHIEQAGHELQVFYEVEEARSWLGLAVERP